MGFKLKELANPLFLMHWVLILVVVLGIWSVTENMHIVIRLVTAFVGLGLTDIISEHAFEL